MLPKNVPLSTKKIHNLWGLHSCLVRHQPNLTTEISNVKCVRHAKLYHKQCKYNIVYTYSLST